ALGQLERPLDLPARARRPRRTPRGRRGGAEDEIVGGLVRIADAAAGEEPVRHPLPVEAPRHRPPRPVGPPGPVAARPGREPPPGRRRPFACRWADWHGLFGLRATHFLSILLRAAHPFDPIPGAASTPHNCLVDANGTPT